MRQTDPGRLYIVATPIGNLEDITRRAVEVLSSVDAIAAEDTRHSRKLLQHLGIDTPTFALHEHNEDKQSTAVINRLLQGENIALVSDAGTPLISDPGYPLVNRAQQAGIKVIPVPGPSSLLAALSVAGLPTDRFVFEGFLPAKSGTRRNHLKALAGERRTLVFFESPHRIADTLSDMAAVFGDERQAVIARELTKTFETILPGTLVSLIEILEADSNQGRGEFVLVVSGASGQDRDLDDASLHLLQVLLEELPLKQASALAARITGKSKNAFYRAGVDTVEK